ncbi:MAG: helix-turn-helix domain-containing protein [Pleomorphochaeta sp.]
MEKIYFNESIDFILFIDTISNIDYFNQKITDLKKDSPFSFNDENLLNYIKFINRYYKTYTFLEKNFLITYFNNTNVLFNYLNYLLFRKMNFNDINLNTFKNFLNHYYATDIMCRLSEIELITIINSKDGNLNNNIDVLKSANLILSIIEDSDVLSSFTLELNKIHEKYKKDLFNNDKETIKKSIININNELNNNSDEFYKKINNFYDSNTIKDYKLIYSYYCPYIYNIHLSAKHIVFGDFILNSKNDDEEYFILLAKYLSQPKRYKIIKLLSNKQYYSNELAKELDLSAATMNYHINKLYDLGLINVEEGKQNKLFIDLNKNRLKYLLKGIQKDLLS